MMRRIIKVSKRPTSLSLFLRTQRPRCVALVVQFLVESVFPNNFCLFNYSLDNIHDHVTTDSLHIFRMIYRSSVYFNFL